MTTMHGRAVIKSEQFPSTCLTAMSQSVIAADKVKEAEATKKSKENGDKDEIFGPGLGVLLLYMWILSRQAGGYHNDMKASGTRSNEAQNMVSDVDAAIAAIDITGKPDAKEKITKKLFDYLRKNPNLLEGTTLGNENSQWSKKELTIIRGNIQAYATQNSETVSQSQLQVQKIMQTYNVTVGLMNSLQTMMGDMFKMFAQSIRY